MFIPTPRATPRLDLLASGLLSALISGESALAANGTWVGPAGAPAASYNWTTTTLWNVTPLYPNGNGEVARFDMNNAGTPTTQMIVNTPLRLGVLDYNESGNTNFTLGNGSNSITFNNGGSTAFLNATKQATLEGSPDASGTSLLRFHVNVNLVLEDNLNVQLKSSRNSDWTNVISGAGRLTIDTTGSAGYGTGDDVGLGGASANTHSGGTKLIGNGATTTALEFTTDKANAFGTGLLELQTARLQLNQDQTVSGLSGPSGVILSNGAAPRTLTLNFASGAGPHTYSGTLENSGTQTLGLTLNGSGTQILSSGSNDYAGGTSILNGMLVAQGGGAIGNASAVSLANAAGASLRLDAAESIGSLAGGGAAGGGVNLQSFTLTTGGNGGSTSHAGVISGTGGLAKIGAGTQTLTGANSFSGAVAVNGGVLSVPSVASTGTNQPLGTSASAISLSSGALEYTGAGSASLGRGLAVTSAGTLRVSAGTLTLAGGVNSASASFQKSGAGTLNLTANAEMNNMVVSGGTHRQSAGVTAISTSLSGLTVQTGSVYDLAGGTLRAFRIEQAGGSFSWGAARLTHFANAATASSGDYSSPGYHAVRAGSVLQVVGNLNSGAGSILAMHGSPTLYLSGSVLYNTVTVSGNLNLSGAGDTLEFELNPYLLRPVSYGAGASATEYGSLPLVTWGGTLSGAFDLVTGIGDDGRGFAASAFPVSGPGAAAALDVNTYHLEYDLGNRTLWLHYKVSGYVPEPGSFALMALGSFLLRSARRRRA